MYTVTYRNYLKTGEFVTAKSFTWSHEDQAKSDARLALEIGGEGFGILAALNPCNISVRGPNGKFIKWRNK